MYTIGEFLKLLEVLSQKNRLVFVCSFFTLSSLGSWFLVSCGPSAGFQSSRKIASEKTSETSETSDTDEEGEKPDDKAIPPQIITGAYLTSVECGFSDIPDTGDGKKIVGCRSLDFDLRLENSTAFTTDLDKSEVAAKQHTDESVGIVWQVYYEISTGQENGELFIVRDGDLDDSDAKEQQYERKLSDLLSENLTTGLSSISGDSTGSVKTTVYKIPETTQNIPEDFSVLEESGTYYLFNLAVEPQSFTEGFPGNETLKEWFALSIDTSIYLARDCECQFELISDDGSRLLIDGQIIIEHDGIHAPSSKSGSASLKEGLHKVELKYFQGPRDQLALKLSWKIGAMPDFQLIPPSAFIRND